MWPVPTGFHRGNVSPEVAAQREREYLVANRWRMDAKLQGNGAYLQGDVADAERLYRSAGIDFCDVGLYQLFVHQRRYAEALEILLPRLETKGPSEIGPFLAVCYYGLGDRARGDDHAPEAVRDCGAYYAETYDRPGSNHVDETPNKTPLDSSAKREAAAWHAIAVRYPDGPFGLYCAEKAALAFPDVPAFSMTYAALLRGGSHLDDSLAWYRRCLQTARGSMREDIEYYIWEVERLAANPSYRNTPRVPEP